MDLIESGKHSVGVMHDDPRGFVFFGSDGTNEVVLHLDERAYGYLLADMIALLDADTRAAIATITMATALAE